MPRSRTRFLAATVLAVAAAGLVALAVNGDEAPAHSDIHWDYVGPGGPEHWSELASANAACGAGVQQSPIDLAGAVSADVAPPDIQWTPVESAGVLNNGHTLQVNLMDAGGLMLGDVPFTLKQFHVHHLSEHTINGAHYPLEIHFVHQSAEGALAVIGVFVDEGEEENPALAPIWAAAPMTEGAAPLAAVDPRAFLPLDDTEFHYAGSLTTPPCSETVTWTVFATPITASADQIAFFSELFPANNRPVQPRNRRFVLSTD